MKKAIVIGTVLVAAAVAALAPSAGSSASGDVTVLSQRNGLSRWAHVLRLVAARSAPSASARAIRVISNTTPEGTNNLVLALESKGPWVRVRPAVLPNGTTGWVPRKALSPYRGVWTHLVEQGTEDGHAAPTREGDLPCARRRRPLLPAHASGEFYVRMKLTRFTDPMYGPIAFDERPRSQPHRLARRRLHRHPRNGQAPAPARRRLTRVHPAEERRHPPARLADARRNAGHRALSRGARGVRDRLYTPAPLMRLLRAHARTACALVIVLVFGAVASTASARPGALLVAGRRRRRRRGRNWSPVGFEADRPARCSCDRR